jgi:ribosomal protein S18 acetylase RimI-like enzyme
MLETYADILPGPDIVAHCAKHHAADAYAAFLADPACTIWLAQTGTGAIIGYLLLIPATLPEEPQPGDLEILRLYVLSRYHGTGTGRALMNTALDAAASRGSRRVVLGVLGVNATALAFYARCGFETIDKRIFQVGQTICDDLVLARALETEPSERNP